MALHIRLATPDDAAAIAAVYEPAVTSAATSFEYDAPDAGEIARRLSSTLERLPWLVCADDDHPVGYAYASRHRDRAAYQWSVEVSAYVDPRAHRRGIGRALYVSLFEVLAAQGFYNAYAGITLPNPASVGLHEAVGFTRIGAFHRIGFKHGAWHDVVWYERRLADGIAPSGPPRTLPELLSTAAYRAALAAGEASLRS